MHITILGGAGFLGRKLAARLVAEARATSLTLFDRVAPPPLDAPFLARRARRLGFVEQSCLPAIIAAFREDDLAATRADRGM